MTETITNIVDPLTPLLRDALATASSFVPLKCLRHGYLDELFLSAKVISLLPGQSLFEKGQCDGHYYYLLSGEMELRFDDDRNNLWMLFLPQGQFKHRPFI